MKMIFKTTGRLFKLMLIAAGWATLSPLDAQEPEYGYVRLVNAVAKGTGAVMVLIDGENINTAGYKLGAVTGGIGLKPGSHSVTIQREGAESGTTTVKVVKDETTTLIPFAEKVPAADDKPATWAIRILRLKEQAAQHERGATFVSVARQPEIKVEVGRGRGQWDAASVERLSIARLPVKESGGYVPIRINGEELPAMAVPSAGNYVVILYEDAEEKMRSLNFRDIKFLSAD
ncbi:MAG TPA: hypothetical protein VF258_02845 [Luteolibacter sp.]